MDGEHLERDDGARGESGAPVSRRDFLRGFATLSAATVLLGVSAGCACSPGAVYGPPPVAVYGPPPREITPTPEPTRVPTPEPTRTQSPTGVPRVVYGPPPVP